MQGRFADRTSGAALTPPPPLPGGTGRYFYLLHRPWDSSSPQPDGVQAIVDSGGVGANTGNTHARIGTDTGIDSAVHAIIRKNLDTNTSLEPLAELLRSAVSWYYLGAFDGPILRLASKNELVFRVPEAWLQQNALSCVEYPATSQERLESNADTAFGAGIFLTTLVVPLRYRITSPGPLQHEKERAMAAKDVNLRIYRAHVKKDPLSRSSVVHTRLATEKTTGGANKAPRGDILDTYNFWA